MTHFVLHIGPHKTGTTAIQEFLSINRERLLEQGVDFPLLGRTIQGAQAHRHFSAYVRGKPNEIPEGFLEELGCWESKAPICLLSSEDFWFCSTEKAVARAKSLFGSDVLVICYLRDPVLHILSMYKESLKSGNVDELSEFVLRYTQGLSEVYVDNIDESPESLKGKLKKRSKQFSYYRYEENIRIWQQAFDNVVVKPYCEASDIVDRFLTDSNLIINTVTFQKPEKVNVSLSDEAAVVLMRVNRMLADGIIDEASRKRFKGIVAKHQKKILEKLSPFMDYRTVNFHDFIAVFRQANPNPAIDFQTSPESLSFPCSMRITDADMLEVLHSAAAKPSVTDQDNQGVVVR